MSVSDAKRLKELEAENNRLKKLLKTEKHPTKTLSHSRRKMRYRGNKEATNFGYSAFLGIQNSKLNEKISKLNENR